MDWKVDHSFCAPMENKARTCYLVIVQLCKIPPYCAWQAEHTLISVLLHVCSSLLVLCHKLCARSCGC
jgi:hypothetical protein